MAELKYTTIVKYSEDAEIGDEIAVADIHGEIIDIKINGNDQMVYTLKLIGVTAKKRQTAMLIIAKKLPITTLK